MYRSIREKQKRRRSPENGALKKQTGLLENNQFHCPAETTRAHLVIINAA